MKKFCSDTCRAGYREQRIVKTILAVEEGLAELGEQMLDVVPVIQQMAARMKALNAQLRQARASSRKK